jgi:DNA topoisomerase-2
MSKTKAKAKITNIKTDAEKYDKKTPREHVLLRPDTYIGDIESTTEDMWIYSSEKNRMIKKNITYTPGFLKVFDEVLVNARDASVNDDTCDTIKIEYNIDEGYISVWNNGDIGIPVEEHPVHKSLVPTMIFGELLTSSNYNDEEERITGGKNGLGAKLASIFATRFIVQVDDAKRAKRFKQEWYDNMLNVSDAEVTKLPAKTKSSVKITFYPDFKRFGITNLNNDHISLFHRRIIDIAGTSNNKLKVFFNDVKIDINNFKSYIEMYYSNTETELYYDNSNERWTIGVIYMPDLGGEVVSFVNSINTYRGGSHCTHVIDTIIKTLISDYIKKKDKEIKVTPTLLKENLVFFINSIIINPAFSSQTKDTLTSKIDKFGSKYECKKNRW